MCLFKVTFVCTVSANIQVLCNVIVALVNSCFRSQESACLDKYFLLQTYSLCSLYFYLCAFDSDIYITIRSSIQLL